MSSSWFHDHVRFKDVANGFQSYAVAAGVMVGGLWAAYQFHALHSADMATTELEAKRIANERAPVITVDIGAQTQDIPGLGHKAMIVTVTLQNSGSDTAHLNFGDHEDIPLNAYPYDLSSRKFVVSARPIAIAGRKIGQDTVRPHTQQHLYYLVDPGIPGTYLLEFSTHAPRPEDAPADSVYSYFGSAIVTFDPGSTRWR